MKSFYLSLVILFFSGPLFAQTLPPMGSAASFALLGATTVTATGIDTISGNIGVSPGTAVTGFPPGVILNGAIYTGGDPMAVNAQRDAHIAYDNLVNQPYPPSHDLSGLVLGTSKGADTLLPGVYHFGAAAQLTGTLVLNDGGNPNAIFIFQLGTTLTTTANSTVMMTSGGVGKNVYWQIGSSSTFGAGTAFVGNLIAFTSNTMNPGAFTTGKVFALGAAVTVNGTVVQAVSKTWSGKAGTHNWGDDGNWDTPGVPKITDNVDLIDADTININVGAITKNLFLDNPKLLLTINAGDSLIVSKIFRLTSGTLVNNSTLIMYGDIRDSAAKIQSSGTVILRGNAIQTLAATLFMNNNTQNLTLNNYAGVTLAGLLSVNGVLSMTRSVFSTGGFLTLGSNALSTGLIDPASVGILTGKVTMQRYLTAGFGYKYISSPFQAATVTQLGTVIDLKAAFPAFYSYTENYSGYGFTIDTAASAVLSPMTGYAANFGSSTASKTFSLNGALNNGNLSLMLYNHNQPYTLGFNLVGNPYPSPIDWDAVSGWTRTNVDNAVYYFDSGSTNQYTGGYSTYVNGVSSDGIAGNIIASMQGFFVHVTNGTYPVTGTLGMTNSIRVTNQAPVFHKGTSFHPVAQGLIRLSANFEGSRSDQAVVYENETAVPFFNKKLDAVKLMNTATEIPSLYLMPEGNDRLAIKAVTSLASKVIIPLGLRIIQDGAITLSLQTLENPPGTLHLYLKDSETGIVQDLKKKAAYTLQLKKGVYEKRFSLICTGAAAAMPLVYIPAFLAAGFRSE